MAQEGASQAVDSLETPAGHPFRLMSLPCFLAAQVEQYLAWMENG